MHTDNLLDLLLPEIISFILKYLTEQELKNSRSINNIWEGEANLFLRGLLPENTFKVLLDGLEVLALYEIVERLDQAERCSA